MTMYRKPERWRFQAELLSHRRIKSVTLVGGQRATDDAAARRQYDALLRLGKLPVNISLQAYDKWGDTASGWRNWQLRSKRILFFRNESSGPYKTKRDAV